MLRCAILLSAFIIVPVVLSQPAWFDAYLLPSPVGLRGTVVDANNRPVAGVTLSGVEQDGEFVHRLDLPGNGGFTLRTRSPSLVFRKDGFESQFFRVNGSKNMRIVLRRTPLVPLPECNAAARCEKGDVFCLPKRSGLRLRRRSEGMIDAWSEAFVPRKEFGAQTILTHGGGPSWLGEPKLRQIWSSVKGPPRINHCLSVRLLLLLGIQQWQGNRGAA